MQDGLIVIGLDAHKRTHTMVATDAVGRQLAEATVDWLAVGGMRSVPRRLGLQRVGRARDASPSRPAPCG